MNIPNLFAVTKCLPLLLCLSTQCHAWGPEVHHVIGLLAQQQLDEKVAGALHQLMATDSTEDIAATCNWPDQYRATEQGAWSAPQHYINVPDGGTDFEPARDCPSGMCVSGAISRYASELADESLSQEVRQNAWARLCHFMGDIHQPLHVGYRSDRGGNDVEVSWRGQQMDLHDFWDHALLEENYENWRQLTQDLAYLTGTTTPGAPLDEEVLLWASESHELVRQFAYPPAAKISERFAAASWLLARLRIAQAADRLAWLTDELLAEP